MTELSPILGRADLQIHTDASDGMDDARTILNAARQRGINVIAVTDHDQVRGALLAREIATQTSHPVQVIVGSEVSSRAGHILALWIEEPISAFRSAAATVEAIWKQGGVAVIAHPGAIVPLSLSPADIDRLVRDLIPERSGDQPPTLAIETANPIPSARWRRSRILAENRSWGLTETGGSDAHFHEQVAAGLTRFPGRDAASLHAALETGATSSELGRYPSLRALGLGRLLRQQWLGVSATPKALWRRRLG